MWNWYEWDSIESFNAWHNSLCEALGYPLTSVNQATGEQEPEATKTIAYTDPIVVNDKIIALVELEYAEGLILTELRQEKLRLV
jgi:hypothetical protein